MKAFLSEKCLNVVILAGKGCSLFRPSHDKGLSSKNVKKNLIIYRSNISVNNMNSFLKAPAENESIQLCQHFIFYIYNEVS
jgi:hypothetical protein